MKERGEEAIFSPSIQRERKKKVLFCRHNVVSRCDAPLPFLSYSVTRWVFLLYGAQLLNFCIKFFRHRPRLPQENMSSLYYVHSRGYLVMAGLF